MKSIHKLKGIKKNEVKAAETSSIPRVQKQRQAAVSEVE